MVFCDVGQGDSIFFRTSAGIDVLVDGGPDDKVLGCLGENLPFWDREIDMLILTHPHADHFTGLTYVLKRYKVKHFLSTGIEGNTEIYRKLKDLLAEHHVSAKNLEAGDRIRLGDESVIDVLWPSPAWIDGRYQSMSEDRLNESSLVLLLKYGSFEAMLTGDAEDLILKELSLSDVEILKVPHHGSKGALTEEILQPLRPELSVIMVGRNSYGHPSGEIIDILSTAGVKTLRTDLDGDVKIETDGKNWVVKK
ncbi:MAG: hypothetical protein A2186_02345 [Candidatus Levybacteria bacterium RIFOXYA1_FULL_41_10]|nr:MAG: hypothetical protein A2423_02485 [Candidatus Levybacteria bacterium RIFOXYC1_FULL_40_10]OGH58224.1 MAG: hypothetical protein A2186_02345 [Candidatus Levybacteria bacterium RIFOXYA1_FULL_41_10]